MTLWTRLYEQGDEDQIVDLLSSHYGVWPKFSIECSMLDHWTWKYRLNPVHMGIISICLDNDQIVGCFHIMPLRVKMGKNIYVSGAGTDLIVHKDYRGRGIYSKLQEERDNESKRLGIGFTFGVSDNPIVIEKTRRMVSGELQYKPYTWIKIKDVKKFSKYHGSESKVYMYDLLSRLRKLGPGQEMDTAGVDVEIVDTFNEEMDKYWSRIASKYLFSVEKKSLYLNWRYCSPYSGEYIKFLAKKDGLVQGFAVVAINQLDPDNVEFKVADFNYDSVSAGYALCEAIDSCFEEAHANSFHWLITEKHPIEKMAGSLRLLNSRSLNYLTYVRNSDFFREDEILFERSTPEQVMFVSGDYDSV